MKLFNIFCIISLVAFAFSSCEQHEVIQPVTEIASQDLSSARIALDIVDKTQVSHGMENNGIEVVQRDNGDNNTAEICLIDFSSAVPGEVDNDSASTGKKKVNP